MNLSMSLVKRAMWLTPSNKVSMRRLLRMPGDDVLASCEQVAAPAATHGGTIASLQSATVVSLHGLMSISGPVGVSILYRDYNARERYGALAGSCTHLRGLSVSS